jgi:hypothetical protein
MNNMRLFLFVFIAAVICPACKKNNVNERDKVEIYLLYQLLNKKSLIRWLLKHSDYSN